MISSLKKILIISFVFAVFLAPAFGVLRAQVTTKQSGAVTGCYSNGSEVPCDSFDQLITAVKNVVNYAILIALAFSVVVLAKAGWIYMTSGGSASERSKANQMFVKVLWGIGWTLGAWLVVNLIVTALVDPAHITNILK